MSSFELIRQKLEQFIKKYYISSLIRGSILFVATGLLYLLVTLLVEHFLWLNTTGRSILFWAFVLVELVLFGRFILQPILQLVKVKKGLDEEQASRIIGEHFSDVDDKLVNLIQLKRSSTQSDLMLASIEQRSKELSPIPFPKAVNFRANVKHLKYLAIPLGLYLLVSLISGGDIFSSSYERVVNFDTAYEPPAPFVLQIRNSELEAIEGKDFVLRVQVLGETMPESVQIEYNQGRYLMENSGPGQYKYVFQQPQQDLEFRLMGGQVEAGPYLLTVVNTPSISSFEMQMDYPAYTNIKDETLSGTGNATIPEGTQVKWIVSTRNTESVVLSTSDSIYPFTAETNRFFLEERLSRSLEYEVRSSNLALKDYERLAYRLKVIRDQYPEIQLAARQDSVDLEAVYYLGRLSDDYGLSRLRLVYSKTGQDKSSSELELPVSPGVFDQFVYRFPNGLDLEEGQTYEYYFEVFDNDGVNGSKGTKSKVFSYRVLTEQERESEQLQSQQQAVEGLDNSLEKLREQEKQLSELSRTAKEKTDLNWNDRKKLEQYLQRQRSQEEMMKNFTKDLKRNLEEFQTEKEDDPFKEELQRRLEENERRMEENEELLKELERLRENLKDEELGEELDRLAKRNKNQEKNLEQLVELTKRYYVAKKAEKLSEEMFQLGEEQEKLSEKTPAENTPEAQEELNERFDDLKKELDKLEQENEKLKSPMEISRDKTGEKVVDKEQKDATEQLQKENTPAAAPSQKKAGERMKQMGGEMQMQMMGGQMESMEEDIEMLRQILDNLVIYSFEQEALMEEFQSIDYGNAVFGKKLNLQNDLKQNFRHIDDSLFEISLRQPMISEAVNESITEVQYNIDKAMERLAESEMRQGIANQQYAVTGANELAVLLSDLLGNMQNQMQASGQGQGEGQGQDFQLPDIIQQQESLNEQMQQGMQQGQQQGQQQGEQGQEGEQQGSEGQEGQEGDQGQEGNGQDGKEGERGKSERGGSNSNGEMSSALLYEIYKQQQMLRMQLEDRLRKEGLEGNSKELIDEMKAVEQMLLDKGFNRETLERMQRLRHQLLKLDDAEFTQGEKEEREARSNTRDFQNQLRLEPEAYKNYFNTTEILTREALPLRQQYKEKVRAYFSRDND